MMLGFNATLRQDANGRRWTSALQIRSNEERTLASNERRRISIARQSADDQSRIRSVGVGTDTSKLPDAEVELLQCALIAP